LKLKVLITFDIIRVDNFRGHIWNQHIVLIEMSRNGENRRGRLITTHQPTHQPTHPDNKGFRDFEKGGSSPVFLKTQLWCTNNVLKLKDCQVDPIANVSLFSSEDKNIISGKNIFQYFF